MFCWRSQIDGLEAGHDTTDYIPLLERRFWRGLPAKAAAGEGTEEKSE